MIDALVWGARVWNTVKFVAQSLLAAWLTMQAVGRELDAFLKACAPEVEEIIAEQIAECQTTKPPYMSLREADRRKRAGQEQVFCKLCERWKWGDELCQMHRV